MSEPALGPTEKTSRGFEIIKFEDRYSAKCSLQQSSLAEFEQPGTSAVWLGVDDASPMVLASDAEKVGLKTSATEGWILYPIPSEVLLTTRMHLDRNQVAALIGHLQNWLDRGTFEGKS